MLINLAWGARIEATMLRRQVETALWNDELAICTTGVPSGAWGFYNKDKVRLMKKLLLHLGPVISPHQT